VKTNFCKDCIFHRPKIAFSSGEHWKDYDENYCLESLPNLDIDLNIGKYNAFNVDFDALADKTGHCEDIRKSCPESCPNFKPKIKTNCSDCVNALHYDRSFPFFLKCKAHVSPVDNEPEYCEYARAHYDHDVDCPKFKSHLAETQESIIKDFKKLMFKTAVVLLTAVALWFLFPF